MKFDCYKSGIKHNTLCNLLGWSQVLVDQIPKIQILRTKLYLIVSHFSYKSIKSK